MSPEQRKLARHALGLEGGRARSYRNRYAAATCTPVWNAWVDMQTSGWAKIYYRASSLDHFQLTRAGAALALDSGETLDPEDFPQP